jgi:hypothetical protein
MTNKYIVVENSSDVSYKEKIESLADVVWINNDTDLRCSNANAIAIHKGIEHIDGGSVFFCHNDVCVTSEKFYEEMARRSEENVIVGTVLDPARIKAVHISGLLVSPEIDVKSLDFYPQYKGKVQVLDVGDILTKHCRENDLPHYCCPNTFNDPALVDSLSSPYKSFGVDRCVVDGEVVYMHLGRGIEKMMGKYKKKNKTYFNPWKEFCEEVVFG